MTDFELLVSWRAGDKAAGGLLFNRYFSQIYGFVSRRVAIRTDAEDLVQETFLACVKGRDTFRQESSFRTYLLKVASHIVIGYLRRRRTRQTVDDVDVGLIESLSTSIGQRLSRREDAALLLRALQRLPPDQQLLIGLRYWEELDAGALAEVFDIEEATTRSRLFRAREQLLRHFDDLKACSGPHAVDPTALEGWARTVCSARQPTESDGSAQGGAVSREDPERPDGS